MSNTLSSNNFGLKLYNRFPHKYREDDVDQNYALKRYLESLADGGFKTVIDETNGILSLVDPDTVRADLLPVLFKQYGLEIFNGIPEEYLRYLLPNLSEAWARKGSVSVVDYITSSLTGMQTSTFVRYDENNNPIVDVKLEMDSSLNDYVPNSAQFKRLLENFVPFYCDVVLVYTYLFLEDKKLIPLESDGMKITDTKIDLVKFDALIEEGKQFIKSKMEEESKIKGVEEEHLKYILKTVLDNISVRFGDLVGKEKISTKSNDGVSFDGVENLVKQSIVTKPLKDDLKVSISEYARNIMKTPFVHDIPKVRFGEIFNNLQCSTSYKEQGVIRLRQVLDNPELNATFGFATMGTALFDFGQETSDTIKDTVHLKDSDELGVSLFDSNSSTNNINATLNTGFYTNTFISYDVITIGSNVDVRFN